MYIDSFTVYIVFPQHIVGTSTVSDDEYAVKVDEWLKDRPVEEVQPSTEGRAVSAYVIDDRIGTLSKAWRDRELAEQDLRLTPGQMKWLKDKAPKCPIKYDNTDLLVKPSSCAGFDEEALRTYIIHELSTMPALAQVCNGVKKFCIMDISRPCIKCPYTRELMPLGRALVPPYNDINRELKVTCGKAAASAFAKFIEDSVPATDDTFRGDLELLCTRNNFTPDMLVDRKEDASGTTTNARTITVAFLHAWFDARQELQRYIRTQDAKIKDLQRQLQELKNSKGKEPEEVIVISSDDEHGPAESLTLSVPEAKRRRISHPKWLEVGQIVEYTGDGYRSSWPLEKRLCRVIKVDRFNNIILEFPSDGSRLHTIQGIATAITRPLRMTPAVQAALNAISDSDNDNQAGPAL